MNSFIIKYFKKVDNFLRKLDKTTRKRIENKINALSENPLQKGVVRVQRYKNYKIFRIRTGNYRVLYSVDFEAKEIIIIKVDKRSKAYL